MGWDTKLQALFKNEEVWDVDDSDDSIIRELAKAADQGVDVVGVTDEALNTFTHLAALWDRPRVLEFLIRRGAELNATNKVGHTPADLAMHWGNADLAIQLKHYGGKHSCEQERDLAIAQRDIAASHVADAKSKMEKALAEALALSKEREGLRIERDRLVVEMDELSHDAAQVRADCVTYRTLFETQEAQMSALKLELEKVRSQMSAEVKTKTNALEGWTKAEAHAKEMQRMREIAMQCEEEAVKMRDEAMAERDAARDLMTQAQTDHVVAVTVQKQAALERALAIKEKNEALATIQAQIAEWSAKVRAAEEDRAMIQVEINRQKASLEARCKALEKEVARVNLLNTILEGQLRDATTKLSTAESTTESSVVAMEKSTRKAKRLENEIKELMEARVEEKRLWRFKESQALHEESQANMQLLLQAALRLWKKLSDLEWIFAFVTHPNESLLVEPETPPKPLLRRPSTTKETLHRMSAPTLSPLPALAPIETKVSIKFTEKLHSIQAKVVEWTKWCVSSLDEGVRWDKALLAQSAQNIECLLTVADGLFDFLAVAMKDKCVEFRKHLEMQAKAVERKDMLLKRFTQHREEHVKKTRALHFRECSYGPC
ncbi:hypothetical protein SDRG_11658 [Saprolegnia diclina VS20]|uniref:Uncharacterized protein n=1 Tax=Saprolegnia diclina (strain VS20) TaxID=1156394 RepID=T0RE89_SAPDV|nr:hypothetical protein SDRG_11658 [Saprolegnia diclina VS20]EQC30603.1 hypothetical protein SDRG_11658 [Saprolegnia diclina VS20]|eukprot:XP_008615929.1 hypothetical protein SDRG_11658 [Saprolegnia diclina VS20]